MRFSVVHLTRFFFSHYYGYYMQAICFAIFIFNLSPYIFFFVGLHGSVWISFLGFCIMLFWIWGCISTKIIAFIQFLFVIFFSFHFIIFDLILVWRYDNRQSVWRPVSPFSYNFFFFTFFVLSHSLLLTVHPVIWLVINRQSHSFLNISFV